MTMGIRVTVSVILLASMVHADWVAPWNDPKALKFSVTKSRKANGPSTSTQAIDEYATPDGAAIYYAHITLGTPPQSFYPQVDTGSDLLWVPCDCIRCANQTDPMIPFVNHPLALRRSTSSEVLQCSSSACDSLATVSPGTFGCADSVAPNISASDPSSGSLCSFDYMYGSGGSTQGPVALDYLHLDGSNATSEKFFTVLGCGRFQAGNAYGEATDGPAGFSAFPDGIIGLGSGPLSLPSQLSNNYNFEKAFGLCLEGDLTAANSGGSSLVVGSTSLPPGKASYTPLRATDTLYIIDVVSMSLGGVPIPIPHNATLLPYNASALISGGTLVDSGTSLARVSVDAANALLTVLNQKFPLLQGDDVATQSNGNIAYLKNMKPYAKSTVEATLAQFSNFELHMSNKASMVFEPRDYIIWHPSAPDTLILSFAIDPTVGTISNTNSLIIGASLLHNKYVVYDLARAQLGWVNINCTTARLSEVQGSPSSPPRAPPTSTVPSIASPPSPSTASPAPPPSLSPSPLPSPTLAPVSSPVISTAPPPSPTSSTPIPPPSTTPSVQAPAPSNSTQQPSSPSSPPAKSALSLFPTRVFCSNMLVAIVMLAAISLSI